MSHFTTINTQIKDIEALKAACAEMGLPVLVNADARGYYQSTTRGEFVIQLQGPYDITVNRQPDGSFGLTADLYAGHVENEVGPNFSRLKQLYAVHKATREARQKGHLVTRNNKANGEIKLVIQGV